MDNNKSEKRATLHLGDNLKYLKSYPDCSFHSVIIDGPYALNSKEYDATEVARKYLQGESYLLGGKGFEGMKWDSDLPSLELLKELYRVLKPGGFVACFASNRTYDILAFTFRFAKFRIKDQLIWTYASGLPKGQWLSKQVKNENESNLLSGLNTALKPAFEPIVLAQKPIEVGETIVSNFLKHGTGALNIESVEVVKKDGKKRYSANIITDGSPVVNAGFANGNANFNICEFTILDSLLNPVLHYSKSQARDRDFGLDMYESNKRRTSIFGKKELDYKNIHVTVKPISLMRHLVRLLSRPGDTVLDCFMGSATTVVAAILENRRCIGMEIDPDYFAVGSERVRRTQELMSKYKANCPEQLMLHAQIDKDETELERLANNLLKNPKDLDLQAQFQKVDSDLRKLKSELRKLRSRAALKEAA